MSLSPSLQKIVEFRGIEKLVAARVLTDDNGDDGYTTGDVFAIAGVATVEKETESSSAAHYYDNIPAVVIQAVGADTITLNVSALPLDVAAELTGQYYDETTGMLVDGPREERYHAIGYIAKNTAGEEIYVWRLKGMFAIPSNTHNTENDSTDANGQELTYTGVRTIHKFTKTGHGANGITVNTAKDLADVSTFFDEVTTPDTLEPKTTTP